VVAESEVVFGGDYMHWLRVLTESLNHLSNFDEKIEFWVHLSDKNISFINNQFANALQGMCHKIKVYNKKGTLFVHALIVLQFFVA
jgi:hypothetical protein